MVVEVGPAGVRAIRTDLGKVDADVLLGKHDLVGQPGEQIAAAQEIKDQVELALGLECWTEQVGVRWGSERAVEFVVGAERGQGSVRRDDSSSSGASDGRTPGN